MWLKLFLLFSILSISSCRYYVNDDENNKNGLNSKNNNNNNEFISSQHQNGQGGFVDDAKMFDASPAHHEIMNSIKAAAHDDTASDAIEIQHQQEQQYGRVKRDYRDDEKWHEKAERWTITFIMLAIVLPIVICCIIICIIAVIIFLCTRAAKPPPPQQQPIIIQRY